MAKTYVVRLPEELAATLLRSCGVSEDTFNKLVSEDTFNKLFWVGRAEEYKMAHEAILALVREARRDEETDEAWAKRVEKLRGVY